MFVQGCGQYSEFSAINVFDELHFDSARSPLKNSKYRIMMKSGL